MIKIFAIGNTLMMDDGISCLVMKSLEEQLKKLSEKIEIYIGETDAMYCFDKIEEEDLVIIVDAACTGKIPGTVTLDLLDDILVNRYGSLHQINLPMLLKIYNQSNGVYIIMIEADQIEYGDSISEILEFKYQEIVRNVKKKIIEIINKGKIGK